MSECPSMAFNPLIRGPACHRVKRYRERAEKLRGIADDFAGQEWRDILLRLCASYEEVADSMEGDQPLPA
jgi:hypothetical protein